jgi:hypothetical protein
MRLRSRRTTRCLLGVVVVLGLVDASYRGFNVFGL